MAASALVMVQLYSQTDVWLQEYTPVVTSFSILHLWVDIGAKFPPIPGDKYMAASALLVVYLQLYSQSDVWLQEDTPVVTSFSILHLWVDIGAKFAPTPGDRYMAASALLVVQL